MTILNQIREILTPRLKKSFDRDYRAYAESVRKGQNSKHASYLFYAGVYNNLVYELNFPNDYSLPQKKCEEAMKLLRKVYCVPTVPQGGRSGENPPLTKRASLDCFNYSKVL